MRRRTIASPLLRGIFATLAGLLLSTTPFEVMELPARCVPSRPPLTVWGATGEVLFDSILWAIGLSGWLLPLCIAVRATLSGRDVRGFNPAIFAGLSITALAGAGFVLHALNGAVTLAQELRHSMLLASARAAVFALAWMVGYEWLSPAELPAPISAQGPASGRRSLRERITRTPAETLGIAFAAGMTLTGCTAYVLLAGDAIDSSFEHVGAVVSSPDDSSRAFVVRAIDGGFGGGYATKVFLLPRSAKWSHNNQGLLIWSGEEIDSVTVTWDSAHALCTRPSDRDMEYARKHRETDLNAYRRNGYAARTDLGDDTRF
jgi:hypothetical protein